MSISGAEYERMDLRDEGTSGADAQALPRCCLWRLAHAVTSLPGHAPNLLGGTPPVQEALRLRSALEAGQDRRLDRERGRSSIKSTSD